MSSDTTAPRLTSLSIPTTVNGSTAGVPLTFSATATDDLSGVQYVYVAFDKNLSVKYSTTSTDYYGTSGFSISGYPDSWSDGSSAQTLYLGNTNAGTYNVSYVSIYDQQGNYRTYSPYELQSLGVNTTMTITGSASDTTAPTVLSFTPTDGATGVSVSSNIALSFSEAIQLGAGTIYLRSGSATGSIVEHFDAATSSRLTVSGSTLTIDPTSNLSSGTQYFVTFGSGVVTDLAGNAYAGTSTYDFGTAAANPTQSAGTNLGAPSTGYFNPTGDNLIDAVTHGYKWVLGSDKTLDFAVANGFNGEYWNNIGLVSDYFKLAVEQFSNFADVKFNFSGNYANPTAAYKAGSEITLSVDSVNKFFSSSNTYATGFFPNSSYNSIYQGAPSDIYLNLNSPANTLPSYLPGSEGWFVLIHELGHTLGLKHPHDDGGTGRPTYSSLGLGGFDIDLMTVMSYKDDGSLNQIGWDPATPMILDIYALQYLYGKNTSINDGDTIFILRADGFYKTLWDPSGTDTLDASTNISGWTIALPEVSLSSLVDTRAGYALPTLDMYLKTPHSLTWLAGDFENAIGTEYSDTIIGNLFNNVLNGSGGNDFISAGFGNDMLFGGKGADTILGGNGADILFGGQGYDQLLGGRGYDDLQGGLGNDTLRGALGQDTLTGGDGQDVFVFETALDGVFNIDTITDFVSGVDRIDLSSAIFSAFSGQRGQSVGLSDYLIYDQASGSLSYDADGTGAAEPLVFALIGTSYHPAIGNDFWIV